MKTYAKLNGGALQIMERVPNISNPTEPQRAQYAAAHGNDKGWTITITT